MTEIREVIEWPPWPQNNGSLRLNEKRKEVIETVFEKEFGSFNWPFLEIRHGNYMWAFGASTDGVDTIETMMGNQTGTIPFSGWQGIEIKWPAARRFVSSVVMAKMCDFNKFRSLQDGSKLPTKGCLGLGRGQVRGSCHQQSEAIFIELYDPSNPEHQVLGEHKYRECPECFRLGDRCSKLAGEMAVDWKKRGAGATVAGHLTTMLMPG